MGDPFVAASRGRRILEIWADRQEAGRGLVMLMLRMLVVVIHFRARVNGRLTVNKHATRQMPRRRSKCEERHRARRLRGHHGLEFALSSRPSDI